MNPAENHIKRADEPPPDNASVTDRGGQITVSGILERAQMLSRGE
jgi:hypothetical protein